MSNKEKTEQKKPEDVQEISKLRELLFGQQFQDHERRYDRLEAKIKKEFEDLRSEMNIRLNALEEVGKNSNKDFEEFKSSTVKTENEIRQITLNSVKNLSNELNRIHANLLSDLAAEIKLLDDEKINKTALATMLGDLIAGLNNWPKNVEKSH